jgi:long-chain acyl-CoA synthetase
MANSIVGLFEETVAANESRPAARFKDDAGQWISKTWTEFSDDRRVIASGLITLGLQPHERVNILSNTSYSWVVADVGAQSCAGEPVAIYQSNLAHEVEYIVNDSDAVMIFVEDAEQLDKVVSRKENMPRIRKVIVMNDDLGVMQADAGDESTRAEESWVITWSQLVELGQGQREQNLAEIASRIEALKPEDVLTLIYTSGTTGKPKGVVLTHANLIYECESLASIDEMITRDDVQLLFLPLAHSFAKVLECYWLTCGHEMAIDSDITQIIPNMAVVRPTVMCSVPRIFEKVFAKVTSAGLDAPGLKGKMFAWALGLNEQYAIKQQEGQLVGLGFQLRLNIAKSLVFSKIEDKLTALFGGRLRYFISGGAPLSKKMAYFFNHAGINILEGYGLTETSAATTVNRADLNKIGSVGKPLQGTEIKIAEDGEILIRGGGVMREYWKREEATQEVLLPDGWFATGDIGELDSDGYLKITDRKKDIIVTAGGKNVAPQNIEGDLKASSPMISQAMVYGDKRKYLTALVTIDADNIAGFAKSNRLEGSYGDWCKSEKVHDLVQGILNDVNKQLPSYETIKKFVILEKDFEIGDELTPTLKMKRKHATQKYMDVLAGMYDEALSV